LNTEDPCGFYAPAIELEVSFDLSLFVCSDDGKEGLFRLRLAAPVEIGIGIKDL
jgi:hypothetical protein